AHHARACVLVDPPPQGSPAPDQRLVRDLVDRAALGIAGDDQATAHQGLYDSDARGLTLDELDEAAPHPRVLAGDQRKKEPTRRFALCLRQTRDHSVGVAGERTGDAADAIESVLRNLAYLSVARLP